jgi:hypothetical protein
MLNRRAFLQTGSHLCASAMAVGAMAVAAQPTAGAVESQRFLLVGLVGSENPTRANFPFAWAAALREAGHEVRIELAGDATVLMRTVVANSLMPVGCPRLAKRWPRSSSSKSPFLSERPAPLPVG